MGRIYNEIRRNIEVLNEVNEQIKRKEIVSVYKIYDTIKALHNINHLVQYCNLHARGVLDVERLDKGKIENFNLPDNFEALVNKWEDNLNENDVNDILDDLREGNDTPPFVPELSNYNSDNYLYFFEEITNGLITNSATTPLGISLEGIQVLTVSLHQNVLDTFINKDFVIPNDGRYSSLTAFIDNPFTQTYRNHRNELGIKDKEEYNYFVEEGENFFNEINSRSSFKNPESDYEKHSKMVRFLQRIRTAEHNPHEKALAIKNAISDYKRVRDNDKNAPSLGEFMYYAKNRLESSIFEQGIKLNDDKDSLFLRSFLTDPIKAMEDDIRKENDNTNINDNVNNNDINSANRYANMIHNEKNNYDRINAGKPDKWAEFENDRRQKYDRYVHELAPSLNPQTIKSSYRGGWFERIFRRTSNEWKDVVKFVENWKNEGPNKGNLIMAENIAAKYLRHKFPNVNPEDVTYEMAQQLNGTARERTLACFAIMDAANRADYETWNVQYQNHLERQNEYRRLALLDNNENFQNQINNEIDNLNNANNNIIQNDDSIEEINTNNIIENNELE